MSNLFLEMLKSIAAEAILTSKFKSDLNVSLLVFMNVHSVNASCSLRARAPLNISSMCLAEVCRLLTVSSYCY